MGDKNDRIAQLEREVDLLWVTLRGVVRMLKATTPPPPACCGDPADCQCHAATGRTPHTGAHSAS